MVNKSGNIGTHSETAVVQVLRANGWPGAERRAKRGHLDPGDITGTPGLCFEVKGGEHARKAQPGEVADWLVQTEAERFNVGADVGILVMARRGYGYPRAGHWWALVRLGPLAALWTFPVDEGGPDLDWGAPYDEGPVVRLELRDLLPVLRRAGYGSPLDADHA